MSKHYKDYFWNNGAPQGLQALDLEEVSKEDSYKIVSDPYLKHISIEAYEKGHFVKVVYDSQFLNFKKLKPEFQQAWERQLLNDGNECLIKDQDDRIILKERYVFKDSLCCECHIFSATDYYLASQYVYYTSLGDLINGVAFYDANDHIVMLKEYQIDELNNFTEVTKTIWSFSPYDKIEIPIQKHRSRSAQR